ncbi:hypothetical protein F5B22DRAFT_27067 [Xylaria bambusicola]|uniref:uncharacterized protein n=1 Tax=Xylaria bambusicola TaxID=326684 RepID=UPI0020088903|nr:uncharacterized protein F5B22DRAFT_27067 [Xylaria bambusicola]KAI0528220.1 hypothetical protein F5B22DRAFT_27067 [Xylaria bambusicola]
MASQSISAESIAEQSITVEQGFLALRSQLPSKHHSMQPSTVQDSHDRFRLWAVNVGAGPSFSRRSLLHRLSSVAPELLGDVCDLLRDIAEAIENLLDITSGNQEDTASTAPPVVPELTLTDSLDQTDVLESDSTDDQATTQLDIANECISSLFRLTALVRKPTAGQDRFPKPPSHEDPFSDHFDIIHVQERYPKLRRLETRWLCERFGRANTKRRQFFRHARERRDRLHNPTPEVPRTPAPDPMGGTTSESLQPVLKDSIEKSMQTTTKAIPVILHQIKGALDAPHRYANSRRTDNGRLLVPNLMDIKKNRDSEFECPFCWVVCNFDTQRAWKHHVFADLKPYVCCLGEGECDDLLFHNRSSWFDHELYCHRRQWVCILCEAGPFETPGIFEHHIKSTHGDLPLDTDGLEAVKDASKRGVDEISAAECPFCDEWHDTLKHNPIRKSYDDPSIQLDNPVLVNLNTFRRHVAHHMEQLALFALPRGLGNDRDEDESNSTILAGRSIEDLSWDSDPAIEDSKEEHASIVSDPMDIDETEGRDNVKGKGIAPVPD